MKKIYFIPCLILSTITNCMEIQKTQKTKKHVKSPCSNSSLIGFEDEWKSLSRVLDSIKKQTAKTTYVFNVIDYYGQYVHQGREVNPSSQQTFLQTNLPGLEHIHCNFTITHAQPSEKVKKEIVDIYMPFSSLFALLNQLPVTYVFPSFKHFFEQETLPKIKKLENPLKNNVLGTLLLGLKFLKEIPSPLLCTQTGITLLSKTTDFQTKLAYFMSFWTALYYNGLENITAINFSPGEESSTPVNHFHELFEHIAHTCDFSEKVLTFESQSVVSPKSLLDLEMHRKNTKKLLRELLTYASNDTYYSKQTAVASLQSIIVSLEKELYAGGINETSVALTSNNNVSNSINGNGTSTRNTAKPKTKNHKKKKKKGKPSTRRLI